ncbi:L,D-transpeptidase family protein [Dongia deserti]|uniref:L,D-transpeptidase family protein n=1 Tax=Dongia deserti TaxID=2268030 RepID=UPI000E651E39|nr:L,D-transpeptidase family protein [Dongia deserti]
MDLIVEAKLGETRGLARLGDRTFPCALGRSGLIANKREGDGGTPIGRFPFRRLLYRADRVPHIETRLPARHIEPADGWCDDPASPDYNRMVHLPHPARHEELWRDDHLYDLIVVIGHNDDPIVPGAGSAVFVHVARDDWGPTAGCIAFRREDLLAILAQVRVGDAVRIQAT